MNTEVTVCYEVYRRLARHSLRAEAKNAIACDRIGYHNIRYHTIQCNKVQYNTTPCNTMQYHKVIEYHCIIWYNGMQYLTILQHIWYISDQNKALLARRIKSCKAPAARRAAKTLVHHIYAVVEPWRKDWDRHNLEKEQESRAPQAPGCPAKVQGGVWKTNCALKFLELNDNLGPFSAIYRQMFWNGENLFWQI